MRQTPRERNPAMNAKTHETKTTGAARKAQQQARLSVVRNEQPTAQEEQTPVAATPVADLKAQRAALDAQIKLAKANQPAKPEKPTKTLADVIAAQLARP